MLLYLSCTVILQQNACMGLWVVSPSYVSVQTSHWGGSQGQRTWIAPIRDRMQGRCFSLCEARVLAQPGADDLLKMEGQASLLYVVRDDASRSQQLRGRDAGNVSVRHHDGTEEQLCAAASLKAAPEPEQQLQPATSSGESNVHEQRAGLPPEDFCQGPSAAMDPETERGLCMHILDACHAFLAGAPTSAEQDARLLQELETGSDQAHSGSRSCCTEQHCMANEEQHCLNKSWQARCHARMGLQYRLQRKLLLCRVAEDLAAQACMLS